mmetsp:Transcript_57691/g.134970  ORF Transcript_57691/g.134970 Transcript_57691/m.134970 type:complete len:225 (+) Transcript_57691:71-745(+)
MSEASMPRFNFAGDPFGARDESMMQGGGGGGGFANLLGGLGSSPQPQIGGSESGKMINDVTGEAIKHLGTLHEMIEQAPHRIKLMCFFGGVAVVFNGIFGVLNVFGAFNNFIFYIVNFYQVVFGIVTCISELHPGFLGQGDTMPDIVDFFQRELHLWAKGLTLLGGRGLFYIFQGSLVVVSSGMLSIGLIIGLYMFFVGCLCISLHFKKNPMRADHPEDYVRVH